MDRIYRRIVFDDLCAAHRGFNLIGANIAPEHSSRCVPGNFVMRRPERNADLLQILSIIGHESHHSREKHHIKATLLLGGSRVQGVRPQAPRVHRFRKCRRSGAVMATDWAGRRSGGAAKVNVGNNVPQVAAGAYNAHIGITMLEASCRETIKSLGSGIFSES